MIWRIGKVNSDCRGKKKKIYCKDNFQGRQTGKVDRLRMTQHEEN